MSDRLIVSFSGPLPSRGQAKAFASFESMLALSQATTMVLHFAETGEIRRRKFAALETDLRLVGTQEGSFEFILEYTAEAKAIGGFVAAAAGGGLLWDVIKGTFFRVIGGDAQGAIKELEESPDYNSGDIGALVQALEPAIRRAHGAINNGTTKIVISIEGHDDSVTFDPISKAYLLDQLVNDETRLQRFQVTSFDGRARTGRLFDLEKKQAFTFELVDFADFHSLRVIANAARAFALRGSGRFDEELEVVCRFHSIDAIDGRIKKIVVGQARKTIEEFGEN